MSESLLDLFNSPQSAPPPPRPRSRSPSASPGPSRRANDQTALFLSPGSNFGDTPRKRPAPSEGPLSPGPVNDDDEYSAPLRELPPPLVPRKRVDAANPLSEGRYVLNDGANPLDPFAAIHGDAAKDGAAGEKKKRVMPKIDADRLMGPNGFPALMRSAKRFKARGKGHEVHDLKNLLNVYQIWAHNMFPKGDFGGTVHRVEKVCRSRRMDSAFKGYRDAFYPAPDITVDAENQSPLRHSSLESTQDQDGPADHVFSEAGRRSSEPLFANTDEPDLDEIMAMEELEREAETAPSKGIAQTIPISTQNPEEEDEWEGLYD